VLDVKSIDEAQRIIVGIATSSSTDRMGDVVEPKGAEFKLPIPLLWQHDSRQPIGEVFAAKVTDQGIEVQARIAKTDVPGQLKDRLDLAWQSISMKLVRGLSIGFNALEEAYTKETGGFHILRWLWLELSAVTIPANQDASIQMIKSLDAGLAASGTTPKVETKPPAGVSAKSRVVSMRTDRPMKKSYADQIAGFEATRTTKSERMDAILAKSADAGTTLDEAEKEEHDTLVAEVKEINEHIGRLKGAEEREKAAAVPARGTTGAEGAQARTSIVMAQKTLPPGIGFARLAMCTAMARGSQSDAIALAKQHYPDDSQLEKAIRVKTAVGAAAIVTSHWADDLVPYQILQDDFITYLRSGNIVDKFGGANPGGGTYPSLRKVPFNVRVSGFNAGTTGNWTGEGLPVLMSKATSFNTTLTWAKVAGLVALTKEEVRFSNPNAEAKVRDDIAKAINTRIDIDFVDPAKAATANVSPASITSGIAATAPAGATAANLVTDIAKVMALFGAANLDVSDVVVIMSAQMAAQISMMTTTLGFPYFPTMTMTGGTLRGLPVLVSENLTAIGSPSTQTIVFAKASEIYCADDGNVTVDASDQAAIEMVDTSSQSGVSGTGASMVSLWQSGLVGILAQREITWALRRSTAVRYISPAAYAA
jgi:HK97 family phage major capsid protein/HK97 family phage prohead protease